MIVDRVNKLCLCCNSQDNHKDVEQQIVEYLDKQTKLIDNIISNENQRLLLLKQYKQSLISEVVTGKKRIFV